MDYCDPLSFFNKGAQFQNISHPNLSRSSRFKILPVGVRGIFSILIISEGIL